jgi:inosine-uridine nucleoside N-ribohydrolase
MVSTLGWVALAIAACAEWEGPKAVMITTDCGVEVDDQWALAHLALSPEIDLKGVVTTHAPNLPKPAAESSARAAREVLSRLALGSRPPVLAGSSNPLEGRDRPRDNKGVRFLIDQAASYTSDHRLIIVVIGAATDVASALLIDPTWADRVSVVAMGFDRWPEGGDPWNVKNDVKAWQVVLASRAPIVVGDSAVSRRHLLITPARAHDLLDRTGAVGYLAGLLDTWLEKNGKLAQAITGDAHTWPIWDEVTVAYLLGLAKTETHPRPSLRDDLSFDHKRPEGSITWVTAIDEQRLWQDLARKLSGATKEH